MTGELPHATGAAAGWSRDEPKRYGFLKSLAKKLLIGVVFLTAIRIALTYLIVRESADHITGYFEQVQMALEEVSR